MEEITLPNLVLPTTLDKPNDHIHILKKLGGKDKQKSIKMPPRVARETSLLSGHTDNSPPFEISLEIPESLQVVDEDTDSSAKGNQQQIIDDIKLKMEQAKQPPQLSHKRKVTLVEYKPLSNLQSKEFWNVVVSFALALSLGGGLYFGWKYLVPIISKLFVSTGPLPEAVVAEEFIPPIPHPPKFSSSSTKSFYDP